MEPAVYFGKKNMRFLFKSGTTVLSRKNYRDRMCVKYHDHVQQDRSRASQLSDPQIPQQDATNSILELLKAGVCGEGGTQMYHPF